MDACARADFARADAAGVALVASVPGVHARDANFGEDAVAAAFRAAARSADEQLDCAVVCHSFGGFGGPADPIRTRRRTRTESGARTALTRCGSTGA